ncbi:MAG: hypothetical protein JW811_00440 [Clostridiales bacterium]|nr:hypothetical protein [Clostridiales bacterium]
MLSDQPITSAKDDLLGRASFARQIASAMLGCAPGKRGSLAVGLYGKWGSGKTSVINMVTEALAKTKGRQPIVIMFNPWDYPAGELLPGQLLQTVADELKKPAHGGKLNKAARAMEKYASALEACSPSFASETVAEFRGGPPKKKKWKKGKKDSHKRLIERRGKVFKRLKKQKQKLYIIMDDIDRLPSRRIRGVLQLVKAAADFPRTVYLLAFDQDVVVSSLGKKLYGDGRRYLEKFIQVQFDVPAPKPGRIRGILMAYISAWIETQRGLNFDSAYFDEVSPFLFACIVSIRDVYRFINAFRVRYQALQNEVNFVDLLAVTAMQLHAPKVLPWIQAHRDDLLRGGGLAYRSADFMKKRRLKAEHRQMIAALDETLADALLRLIGHMFPRYGKNMLDVYLGDADPRFVRMRRICCEEFFDLYFTQSLEGLSITQKEIIRVIRKMDRARLRAYTDGLTQEEHRDAFLNHLPHYLDDIPDERLPLFFHEVLWLSRLPEDKTPTDKPFQRSFFQECCNTALRILTKMRHDTLEQSLSEAVSGANKLTISILVSLLSSIRRGAPGAEGIEIAEDIIVSHLRRLMNKIHSVALHDNWLLSHKPLPVLTAWKQMDAVSFRVYFRKLMLDDGNAARLVSCLTQRFGRGEDMEYQYGDMDGKHAFSEEFTQIDAKEAVLRLRGAEAFRALPEDVRLDSVAFSLMDETMHRVTQQDVLAVYPAWMGEAEGETGPEIKDDQEN